MDHEKRYNVDKIFRSIFQRKKVDINHIKWYNK